MAQEQVPKFSAMSLRLLLLFFLFQVGHSSGETDFVYNGFQHANLTLDGSATIEPNGLLRLTNTTRSLKGHAFHRFPLILKDSSTGNTTTMSFSSTFVFAIIPEDPKFNAHGITLFFSPSDEVPDGLPAQWLGLFNDNNNNKDTNHIFAVELDTSYNSEFKDLVDNHVGVDVNGLNSVRLASAGYYDDKGRLKKFYMSTGERIQIWIEYNGQSKQLDVTVSPTRVAKPSRPLLSFVVDLSPVFLDRMYVGFSSGTGQLVASHYVLGWSFRLNGKARPLTLSSLPSLPRLKPKETSKVLTIGLPLILLFVFSVAATVVTVIIRRKIKFAEVLEDWEREYGPHRFRYKDLFIATRGFGDKELLGIGGFGRVYRGILPSSKKEVAVKKVSHDSRQGMKEFVAEIVSLGRLRHRNLVQLLGYCRRKGELLLVYDYMPNGSLDRFLFDEKTTLDWYQRFRIIKGVASGLLYLHEEWEQIVLHRDIKASNVLLDNEHNGRLGDFGLARLYDHGADPRTTHVVGTLGYMAPEMARTSKATTSSDVYAFGAFLLEVATGRRPIDPCVSSGEELVLVDWVFECWKTGALLEASDQKLGRGGYVAEEIELVLKLGLLCSNLVAAARPSMRQVVQFLDGDGPLPDLCVSLKDTSIRRGLAGFTFSSSDATSSDFGLINTWSISESVLSGGR